MPSFKSYNPFRSLCNSKQWRIQKFGKGVSIRIARYSKSHNHVPLWVEPVTSKAQGQVLVARHGMSPRCLYLLLGSTSYLEQDKGVSLESRVPVYMQQCCKCILVLYTWPAKGVSMEPMKPLWTRHCQVSHFVRILTNAMRILGCTHGAKYSLFDLANNSLQPCLYYILYRAHSST